MTKSVLSMGYVALDVVTTDSGTWLRAGGTAANVAANLAHLGWTTSITGAIGDDDAGEAVEADLQHSGVDTSGLKLLPGRGTPLVVHEVTKGHHRYRFGCAVCGRPYRRYRPLPAAEVAHRGEPDHLADVMFFDRPSAAAVSLADTHARENRIVVYEPWARNRTAGHDTALRLAHLVKHSDEDGELTKSTVRGGRHGQVRIVTKGAAGSRVRVCPRAWDEVPAPAVEAVDAGGAGDWMTTALIDALANERWPWAAAMVIEAVRLSQGYAALACMLPGARSLADAFSASELTSAVGDVLSPRRRPVVELPSVRRSAKGRDICEACLLPVRSA